MAAKRKVGPPLFVQASIVVGEKETQPLRIMKENMDAAYLSLMQAQVIFVPLNNVTEAFWARCKLDLTNCTASQY